VNGPKLARLRQAKGWTQQQLAVEAGVHAMTVSSAERGAVEPLLTTIEAIARALGVSVAELLEPEPAEAAS
jgi:transcriptional regulator with XRE-family HTH domain